MRMERFQVRLQGISPILQHRFSEKGQEESGDTMRPAANIRGQTSREQAEDCAYRLEDGTLYLKGIAIMRCFREAAGYHKQRGTRKSMKYVAAGSFIVNAERLPFDGNPKEYEIYSAPVVIPATKGRVMRHRPKLEEWAVTFE